MSGPNIANAIAIFASSIEVEDIPEKILEVAKLHVLDTIGVALAASTLDFSPPMTGALQTSGASDNVPVIGSDASLSARDAALVNGSLCHGVEFDDTHLASCIHPSAVVVPTALSAAITSDSTTTEFLLAYMIGVEVAIRISLAVKGRFLEDGFHPTSTVGPIAASVAAGRLYEFNAEQLGVAQGIALELTAGQGGMASLDGGAWTKRTLAGWAAVSGLTAALLARQQFTAVDDPYTTRFSLYRMFAPSVADQVDFSRLTDGLGEHWELVDLACKPYPTCHFAHAAIDAAIGLRLSTSPSEIEKIVLRVPPAYVDSTIEPLEQKRRPSSILAAQFSVPFLVAFALSKGKIEFVNLRPEYLVDPEILELAGKFRYEIDEDTDYPNHYPAELHLELRDGTSQTLREAINRGAPDRPLSLHEVHGKFMANASPVLGASKAQALAEMVGELEQPQKMGQLVELLHVRGC